MPSGMTFNVQAVLEREPTKKRYWVFPKTATTTIKANQTGSVFDNLGATSAITFNLPQNAVKGNEFHFFVAAGYALIIDPGAAGAIYINGAKQTDSESIQSAVIGDSISLVADGNGDWYALNQNGIWQENDLWVDCPWEAILRDPTLGYAYFNDFTGDFDPESGDGWTITQVTSGALSKADELGGVLLVDSGGNASADDGVNAQMDGEMWKPAAGKTLWFEARAKFSDIATTPDQFFLGLAATQTALIASGALEDAVSKVGWFSDAGTTAATMEFVSAKTSSEEIQTTAGGVMANATYYRLGFKFNGVTSITPYKDGTAGTAIVDTDDISIEEMKLSLVAQCEQVAADAEMSLDWIRIAQLR